MVQSLEWFSSTGRKRSFPPVSTLIGWKSCVRTRSRSRSTVLEDEEENRCGETKQKQELGGLISSMNEGNFNRSDIGGGPTVLLLLLQYCVCVDHIAFLSPRHRDWANVFYLFVTLHLLTVSFSMRLCDYGTPGNK